MKESTGAISSVYIIIFFIVIMFGFILSTLSYYKSYKVNNSLIAAIEDYGGYNSKSKEEITKRLKSYGYNTNAKIKCTTNSDSEKIIDGDGKVISNQSYDADGYCVSIVDESNNGDFEYYSYKVSTYLILDFGIFNFKFPYKMSTRSTTMFNCFGINCGVDSE